MPRRGLGDVVEQARHESMQITGQSRAPPQQGCGVGFGPRARSAVLAGPGVEVMVGSAARGFDMKLAAVELHVEVAQLRVVIPVGIELGR